MSIKKEFKVEGLDCASCATKIEDRLSKMEEISDVNVNFIGEKLTFYVDDDKNMNELLNKITANINEVEEGVTIKSIETSNSDDTEFKTEFKKRLTILITALVLFFSVMIFDFNPNLEIGLLLISYILVGFPVLSSSIKNIAKGNVFDENFLMSIATIGAFLIGEYSEGVAVMLFYQVGELFQDYAVNSSRNSIKSLMDLKPEFANIFVDGEIKKVSPSEVKIDDVILVKVGEKIPLDGTIIEGTSTLDTSALTGESKYANVNEGDFVMSGSINMSSVLKIKVEKEFNDSTVSKILELVENASSRKSDTENFITTFAKYYTPFVVVAALLVAIVPPLLNYGTFSEFINRALIFLVISCPCALVISIPLGYFSGIGACSKKGILIKGSNYLEALNSVETVVFDKTGTLTKGDFSVNKIVTKGNFTEDELLKFAFYAENFSTHPIAVSIKNAYDGPFDADKITNLEEISGHGIKTDFEDKKLLIGNDKLMKKENIEFESVSEVDTILYIAVNNNYEGYIVIKDTIKDDSASTIKELKEMGISTVLLTGDNKAIANSVAEDLGITQVYSELLPQDKFEILENLDSKKSKGKKIAFVGDGINDAPVIARADVGIAMGGAGSDLAIEASDVVLINDSPSSILSAIKISKRTQKIVIENIIFALGVKAIILILGFFGIATMWEAVFADVGVSIIAILNSIRIKK